ncbi:MAG: Gfo/Idh/MocA family protein [Candidatus Parvarchaeum sp.]
MEKLRCCIIGLGHQTNSDHIPAIKNSSKTVITAICDIDEKKLKEAQKSLGVKGYKNYKEMIDNEKPDFILVAVPHNQYLEILTYAASKHVNVLKEKPLALNLKEAIEIRDLARKNNIQVMVALQRRFDPIYSSFYKMKEKVGKIFFVEGKYHFLVNDLAQGWRAHKLEAGGGAIIDLGYHMVDLIIWYFGVPDLIHAEFSSRAQENASYDVEDTADILFRFEHPEIIGNLFLSRHYAPKDESITAIGTEGTVILKRDNIVRLNNKGEVVESLDRKQTWTMALKEQIDYFCDVIEGKKKNINPPDYNINHMAFIEACYLSKREGKFVRVNELISKYEK